MEAQRRPDTATYFMQELGGRQSFSSTEKEVILDLTQCISIDEIDEFKQAASPQLLADLRGRARELTTSYLNQQEYNDVLNHSAALQEIVKQNKLEDSILNKVKPIPDKKIQASLSQSLEIVASNHARNMGAPEIVIDKIKKFFTKILKILGLAAVVGGVVYGAAMIGGLGAVGLSVAGIAIVALVIHKTCFKKAITV